MTMMMVVMAKMMKSSSLFFFFVLLVYPTYADNLISEQLLEVPNILRVILWCMSLKL